MYVSSDQKRGLRGLGAIEDRLCRDDQEFCDDFCTQAYLNAKRRDPAMFECITEQKANYLIDVCEKQRSGELAAWEASQIVREAMADPCADLREECRLNFAQWAAVHPEMAACLTDAQQEMIVESCMEVKKGNKFAGQVASELNAMVDACAAQPPEPMPPAGPPPAEVFSPPDAEPSAQMPQLAVEEVPMYTPEPLRSRGNDQGLVKKWGPVVGVLLVVGGAVYLLR